MKYLFLKTIVFVVLFLIPNIVFGAVIINEIMYDLEGADTDREWVEIFNNGDTTVDLTDWKLWEANTNHKLTIFQGSSALPVNTYAIIADRTDKFLLDNPGYSGILFDSTFSLNNDGESLILKDGSLINIDEASYSSSWGASGNGRTLQRESPSGTNWGSGTPTPGILNSISPEPSASESEESTPEQSEAHPTPTTNNNPPVADAGNDIVGFINQEIKFDGSKSSDPDEDELHYEWNMGDGKLIEKPIFTYKYLYPGTYLATLMVYDGRYYAFDTITVKIQAAQITINEFMANPSGEDEEEEWIEIYNDANTIIDISGWQLDDAASGSAGFIFPKNTFIAPKSYLVFPRQITGIALNNDTDIVRLLLPEGIVFQEINYENPPLGKSSARTDEGFVWTVPTPGAPNIIGLADVSDSETKNFIYQQQVQTQTVKNPSGNYAIDYQNNNNSQIQGGYIETTPNPPINEQSLDNQTAMVKPISSDNNPINLILLIIAVISGSALVGMLLVRLRKKSPIPDNAGLQA